MLVKRVSKVRVRGLLLVTLLREARCMCACACACARGMCMCMIVWSVHDCACPSSRKMRKGYVYTTRSTVLLSGSVKLRGGATA